MKRCSCCREMQPRAEFWRATAAPDGLQSYCKPCQREKSRTRNRAQPYDAVKTRTRKRLSRYGIGPDAFETLLRSQGAACAICSKDLLPQGRGTHIDHCHESGAIRGLLCAGCNTALGRIERFGIESFTAYIACPPAVGALS